MAIVTKPARPTASRTGARQVRGPNVQVAPGDHHEPATSLPPARLRSTLKRALGCQRTPARAMLAPDWRKASPVHDHAGAASPLEGDPETRGRRRRRASRGRCCRVQPDAFGEPHRSRRVQRSAGVAPRATTRQPASATTPTGVRSSIAWARLTCGPARGEEFASENHCQSRCGRARPARRGAARLRRIGPGFAPPARARPGVELALTGVEQGGVVDREVAAGGAAVGPSAGQRRRERQAVAPARATIGATT